jgi:hypothetical protein
MKKNKQPLTVAALASALSVFALLLFVLQWNVIIAALLSLGSYLGLSFLLAPPYKPSAAAPGELKNGREILDLLDAGERDLASIALIADSSQDRQIQAKAREVCREGGKIVEYIKKNPHKAVMARRFFNYYLDKANEKDIGLFDIMFDHYSEYFKELELYIIAGELKAKELNDTVIPDILNTIPLWKNQIIIAMGIFKQNKALAMQQEVDRMTKDLLLTNSQTLKETTASVVSLGEKGIVEIETLKKVNADLIATLEETISIQERGKQARKAAEAELVKIESELKTKLVEIKSGSN